MIILIDLFQDFSISFTFNVEDLVNYKSPDFNPNNLLIDEPFLKPFYGNLSLSPFSDIHLNTT